MSRYDRATALLDRTIPAMWRKLDVRERDAVARDFVEWTGARLAAREDDPALWEQLELARFLREQLQTLATLHGELTHRFRVFQERLDLAETQPVREALILEFFASLGAGPRQLRGDRQAFRRWLDVDAVAERYDRERARIERRIRFCLERLGPLAQHLCSVQPTVAGASTWSVLDLEASLRALLGFPGDPRIREAALTCVRTALAGLGDQARTQLSRSTVQYIYRAVLDHRQSLWLQCEALEALARFAPQELQTIAEQRLKDVEAGDSMFFRRRLVEALVAALPDQPHYAEPLRTLCGDPAPFVRKAVAESLARLPATLALEFWLRLVADEVPAVAGQALVQSVALVLDTQLIEPVTSRFLQAIDVDTAEFPLRVAIRLAPGVLARVRTEFPERAGEFHDALEARLTAIHTGHARTAMRRRAATARELLRDTDPPGALERLPLHARGQASQLPDDPIEAARALLPLAQRSFGFNLDSTRKGWSVVRDWVWRPRLWRFLHEFKRPATDKRQNYPHMRGRVYPGLVHVPSTCVAEVSPTKVPGEPLHIAEEDGWRPWLPLLDQVLSALDQDWPTRPLRIVSTEGVTEVRVPDSLVDRLRAKLRISRRFGDIAALRNWTPDSAFTPHAFVDALRECGVRCDFEPHTDGRGSRYPVDPRIRRFFAAGLGWVAAPLQDVREYFYSIYQNSLVHLLLFVGGISAWFFGQHIWLNRRFRSARAKLPLVMGGWGTRGKSGTERLKAAVMSALGLRVLSKTTGCEAMFLFGNPNRVLSEMFLFRPYDKATIWEQARLTRMAAELDTDVMLWECMGLNPGYVRVLQHDWMRDDVSTITNCFPDHEDIQGPAGVDLPLVIRQFIPGGGQLYTSEENMLPFLEEHARAVDTPCVSVDWLDVGLLTPDILARFPYQEHPANIALVARMFEGMGLRRDFALREMADRVVPDLGVLKIYPQAAYEGRRIEFINGMSANERHGCLSNWERTGMGRHRLDTDPHIWTTTVVNNRADRVARSQVFAAILVNDIGADRHFLIGGNLDGLQRFIRESFDEFVASFDWHDTEIGIDAQRAMLDGVLRRWRVPLNDDEADARLRAACVALGVTLQDGSTAEAALDLVAAEAPAHRAALQARWEQDRADAGRVAELHTLIERPDARTADAVRTHLWDAFSARIVPVADYYTPGNVLVQQILRSAPPGLLIRAMGIQNIKGTGLDFVYRWQAWDLHAAHCRALLGGDTETAIAAAQALASSTELGVLEAEALRDAMAHIRSGGLGQTDILQSLLGRIERNLEARLHEIDAYSNAAPQESARGSELRRVVLQAVERFLDAGDAVRRRRTANQIYRDLVAGRIASTRAAYELKQLNQRQKGGWLAG
ncbi:hypothetical protein ACFFGH_08865 [Lysobacter korlensis]|uniref:Capsule biosynthesis protein CapB n=1 Tax=Lysobacter korlensis TaxID=553636 RepID=A0ABV6RLU6_9GAMM